MRRHDGFLLVDAMLTFSIIALITLLIIPMLQQMSRHYDEALKDVERHRQLYVEFLAGEEVVEYPGEYCSSVHRNLCIRKR